MTPPPIVEPFSKEISLDYGSPQIIVIVALNLKRGYSPFCASVLLITLGDSMI